MAYDGAASRSTPGELTVKMFSIASHLDIIDVLHT